MKKVNVPIAKINKSLTVKVSMVFQTDEERHAEKKDRFPGLLQVYVPNDKDAYITFNPKAFVTLEITKRSPDEPWNPNLNANLSNRTLFRFKLNLKWVIQKILTDKAIYDINQNNQVSIDKNKAIKYSKVISCGVGKTLKIQPAVVDDPDNEGCVLKGAVLFINTYDYYSVLTLEDMRFLYETLDKIDLFDYGCNIMNAYTMMSRSINKQISRRS